MLGDLNIAEPGGADRFAGPRVIEQTTRQKLPEGFQRSEFFIAAWVSGRDVERKDLKGYLVQALGWMRQRRRAADETRAAVGA